MALEAGSVTVDANGVETGTGLALELYLAARDTDDEFASAQGAPALPTALRAKQRQYMALRATKEAARLVNYLVANNEVAVTIRADHPPFAGDSGLQRVGMVDTNAPATDKGIFGTFS